MQNPDLNDRYLTGGGLETTLVFHKGCNLPAFAALVLLDHEQGRETLRECIRPYIDIAQASGIPLILETPTWRANPDWLTKIGYEDGAVTRVNRDAMALAKEMRNEAAEKGCSTLISGTLGPRGDGYTAQERMSVGESKDYHAAQVSVLASAGADIVSAMTLTYVEEAIGISEAAKDAGVPVAISFTVETDGKLPSGQGLGKAIEQVDALTSCGPEHFLINCAHPIHIAKALEEPGAWVERVHGLLVNASSKSHAELDVAEEVDEGDPIELADDFKSLLSKLPNIHIFGGCCGTDQRHIMEIQSACL